MSTHEPYGKILKVRPEVLEPTSLVSMVDLSAVAETRRRRRARARANPAHDVLADPEQFFGLTYPTSEIVETIRVLARRAKEPEAVPGTVLLAGHYGSGKSHVMLAAHHALTAPEVAEAWAARWELEPLGLPPSPIVLTRSFIHQASGNLWDVLFEALDQGGSAEGDFLDGDQIQAMLPDRQIYLILDELERWFDAQDPKAQSRSRNFLQALTEVSMRDPRLTLITSVLGQYPEPADTIRRVRPMELTFKSATDRQRILHFRLFADRHEDHAKQAARRVAADWAVAYRNAELPNVDRTQARMEKSWPFTPELVDILTKKVPERGGFQNTRGLLRFLSTVVRSTHDRRPVVSSQDLPFTDDDIVSVLRAIDDADGGEVIRRALGDNYEAVPADLPHKDELFSTLVLASVADVSRPGATEAEILQAVLDPGENAVVIKDSLRTLLDVAYNLHRVEDRFVFKANENPNARINALARSGQVNDASAARILRERLLDVWSTDERGQPSAGVKRSTVLHDSDEEETRKELASVGNRRPKFLISTRALTPKGRLRLQNLDPNRNLVLLIEPQVRTTTESLDFHVLRDADLIRRARRVEACTLLLGSNPTSESEKVYRDTRRRETRQIDQAIRDAFGQYVSWHRAGASDSTVGDDWFELNRLDGFDAGTFLQQLGRDHASQAEVTFDVRSQWEHFRHKPVSELCRHFDRTPGLPVPYREDLVPNAVKHLVRDGEVGLKRPDGAPVLPAAVDALGLQELMTCDLVDPSSISQPDDDPKLTHPMVSGQYDEQAKAAVVSWTLPEPPPGDSLRTLIQRYSSPREWKVGDEVRLDLGETHGANRYHGTDDNYRDIEGLQPGHWYLYYVFLEHQRPGKDPRYVLSKRLDIAVPKEQRPTAPNELQTSVVGSQIKLIAEVERMLYQGGRVPADAVVRKIEIVVRGVVDEKLRAELAPALQERAGDGLEASADLTYAARGEWDRQGALNLVRGTPRFDHATYMATLSLKTTEE